MIPFFNEIFQQNCFFFFFNRLVYVGLFGNFFFNQSFYIKQFLCIYCNTECFTNYIHYANYTFMLSENVSKEMYVFVCFFFPSAP